MNDFILKLSAVLDDLEPVPDQPTENIVDESDMAVPPMLAWMAAISLRFAWMVNKSSVFHGKRSIPISSIKDIKETLNLLELQSIGKISGAFWKKYPCRNERNIQT